MSARAFRVFPGHVVGNVNDRSAVLVASGIVSIGLTVAEARELSVAIARAADEIESSIELRRIAKLPRATQSNPADTCSCGAEAEHTEWRGGHEIGVCASCK